MKKNLLILAAALTAAASCQKNDTAPANTEIKYNPIELTLTASIEGTGTKVSYTEENNVLKAAWEIGDKISLVALDESGNVLSNDVFTSSDAGKSTDFDGKYSKPQSASSVVVIYPALTEGEGTTDEPWKSKQIDKNEGNPLLYKLILNQEYISVNSNYRIQTKNADPSNLRNLAILSGTIDPSSLTSGNATVSLNNCCYVIKATVKVPTSFSKVGRLDLKTDKTNITMSGWTSVNNFIKKHGSTVKELTLALGENLIRGNTSGTGVSPSDGNITAYLVGYIAEQKTLPTDETLTLSVYDPDKRKTTTKTKTLTSGITLEPGKMYRINVDMTK